MHILQPGGVPHCPDHEDECKCSKDLFKSSWCCRPPCYNASDPLPRGPVNCPDNCIASCDRINTYFCCFCDGESTTSTTTSTTTTTKPPPPPPAKNKCFPSTARVTLKDGKTVTMSQLKIGDQVQTGMADCYFWNNSS